MTSIFRFSLYVILICGVLFFTNPEKKDFIAWATLKLYSYGNQQAGAFGAGIAGLVGGPVLNKSITRENYYLFSVFTIDNPLVTKAITESAANAGTTTINGFFSPFIYFPISQGTIEFLQKVSFSKNSMKTYGTNTDIHTNSTISKFIGKYPSEFLSDIKNQDMLRSKVTNNKDELNKIKSYFDVATPIKNEGKFIVGEGCKARECSDFNGIFVLNTENNFFALFYFDGNQVPNARVTYFCGGCKLVEFKNNTNNLNYELPNSVKIWLQERDIL